MQHLSHLRSTRAPRLFPSLLIKVEDTSETPLQRTLSDGSRMGHPHIAEMTATVDTSRNSSLNPSSRRWDIRHAGGDMQKDSRRSHTLFDMFMASRSSLRWSPSRPRWRRISLNFDSAQDAVPQTSTEGVQHVMRLAPNAPPKQFMRMVSPKVRPASPLDIISQGFPHSHRSCMQPLDLRIDVAGGER